eukprot:12895645-Prorocentrum_lima.AAC.1
MGAGSAGAQGGWVVWCAVMRRGWCGMALGGGYVVVVGNGVCTSLRMVQVKVPSPHQSHKIVQN